MSAPYRRVDPGLIEQLGEAPQRFEFFQAVRLLEAWFRREGRTGPDEGAGEQIRFRNSLHLHFAPSQVEALHTQWREDDAGQATGQAERVEITPSFMGMLGLQGGLPIHYTERVASQVRQQRDDSTRAFFDLFSNRAVAHFYRAWKKSQLAIQYEQDRKNRFLPLVLALAGLGFAPLRDRLREVPGAIDDETVAYFAGLLRQRPFSAAALQSLLSGYLGAPMRVESFVGRWYVIPPAQRTTLGLGNAALGHTALVGERVWQRDLRVRIHIGPLSAAQYARFLPRGDYAAVLEKLFALATGFQYEYEIRPILRAPDVQPSRLGSGVRLGFDSFMVTRAVEADRNDARYELHPIH